jgi:hypothetical protein
LPESSSSGGLAVDANQGTGPPIVS